MRAPGTWTSMYTHPTSHTWDKRTDAQLGADAINTSEHWGVLQLKQSRNKKPEEPALEEAGQGEAGSMAGVTEGFMHTWLR